MKLIDDDSEIRRKVIAELAWDPYIDVYPSIDSSTIGVAVKDGVVTLSGSVPSYWHKRMAERAVERVCGVRALADDLLITLPGAVEPTDADIAESAADALSFTEAVPPERVQVTVDNGWVMLEGEVDAEDQKRAVCEAVKSLRGVKGVANSVRVKARS
jgi:osmotically-inducible protein OsmY